MGDVLLLKNKTKDSNKTSWKKSCYPDEVGSFHYLQGLMTIPGGWEGDF